MLVTVLSTGNTGGHENLGFVAVSVPAVLALSLGFCAASWLPAFTVSLNLTCTLSEMLLISPWQFWSFLL